MRSTSISKRVKECKKKFLYYFPGGFNDETYFDWERGYKQQAYETWQEMLSESKYAKLLNEKKYDHIAATAIRIESRTNLLFSFEKMALRDAVKESAGAKNFAIGLFDYLHGKDSMQQRFENFARVLASLPVKQTRVHTWPLQTVFGMIARPDEHIFLKPMVTKRGAEKYGYDFEYTSKPNWHTYQDLLRFAESIREDLPELKPKDMIDLQSFIWVMGSDEYPD